MLKSVISSTSAITADDGVRAKPRVAMICNWGDQCGIATYSGYLVPALRPYLSGLKIFAEDTGVVADDDGVDVEYCWKRGGSPTRMLASLSAWKPDFVLIQHEFGIFPKAGEWLKLLAALKGIPYAVVLHSVYEHQDKAICTSAIKQVVCHTKLGESCLRKLGFQGGVTVIPHGCIDLGDVSELFNKYEVAYPLMQFGFGFSYKGVEVVLDALAILKDRADRKYQDIFFTYLCSEAPHARNIIDSYHTALDKKVAALGLAENVVILRGYRSEEDLHRFLRVNRLAVFPYQSDPANVVYGASGAIRLAFANRVPTIASKSPMFADLDGVVPRPGSAEELAREIDKVFSDESYRRRIVDNMKGFAETTSWPEVAAKYASMMQKIIDGCGARRLIRFA